MATPKPKGQSHLVFVLGGASSGKSEIALQFALKGIGKTVPRAFIATGEGLDEEMATKIARHRKSRSSAWVTAEVPVDLTGWIEKHGQEYRVIVVDCLTMWLSNHCGLGSHDRQVLQDVRIFLQAIRCLAARVVLVANELGMGLVPVDAASRRFRELTGAVNRLIAEEADDSYLIVSGLSIRLK
jgi:adenosylcobinamide kinase / adenosylcobinamide-phosphate guanylyltransferase